MVKKIKHDRHVDDLCNKIKDDYDYILTNVPLYSDTKKGRRIAEIDVLAVKEDRYDVFEVKCSHRITKAKKQLHRIKRILPEVENLFFFCGDSGCLELIV